MLLTGGNLGQVASTLEKARGMIAALIGPEVMRSSVMASEPWGFEAKETFLNQVLVVETELDAEEVLSRIQLIEAELGRKRPVDDNGPERRYASRTIDIDILFYGDRIIDTSSLQIPHPLISQRLFVLRPLAEIMPCFVHPLSGKSVAVMLRELTALEGR